MTRRAARRETDSRGSGDSGPGLLRGMGGARLAERDLAVQVAQHRAGMPVPKWARLLRCTERGAREADFVVSGTSRR